VSSTDKLILLGDFNAQVGRYSTVWEGVIWSSGVGNCNSNALCLLELFSCYELVVTNTIFRLSTWKKTSWMHSHSKHWHLIDYITVRKRDRHDIRLIKAMCGAECWTDHRLITSRMNIRIKPKGVLREGRSRRRSMLQSWKIPPPKMHLVTPWNPNCLNSIL